MQEILQITTTVETQAQAVQLSKLCVEANLAACVQITGPVQSIYRWKGEICEGAEFRCAFKTTSSGHEPLLAKLREHHPYDLPEILIETVTCSSEYGQWVAEQIARP